MALSSAYLVNLNPINSAEFFTIPFTLTSALACAHWSRPGPGSSKYSATFGHVSSSAPAIHTCAVTAASTAPCGVAANVCGTGVMSCGPASLLMGILSPDGPGWNDNPAGGTDVAGDVDGGAG